MVSKRGKDFSESELSFASNRRLKSGAFGSKLGNIYMLVMPIGSCIHSSVVTRKIIAQTQGGPKHGCSSCFGFKSWKLISLNNRSVIWLLTQSLFGKRSIALRPTWRPWPAPRQVFETLYLRRPDACADHRNRFSVWIVSIDSSLNDHRP